MAADEPPVLQLEVERQPESTIVHCTGKVVIDSWAMFTVAVRALIPEGKPILVDLANVSLVDSVGIGTFVSVWASARKSGCALKFINLNADIHDLFEITRLHGLFAGDAPGA